MRNVSITTKITIWYTAFMLVITFCVLGVFIHSGNERASESARSLLMDSVADASEEIERFGGDFVVDDKLKFYEDGVYISIYDGEGELIEGRRPIELTKMPTLDDKKMVKLKGDSGETWYIYDSLFQVDKQFVWVRGFVKDFAEQSPFTFILKLALIALPGLIVVAAIGGYIITRRAFRPVSEVIRTVEEITEDADLSRRINLEETETETNDEIHELARTFNGMFDKLEKSFKQEKQFTSDVSHELRTPLAVIISQSEYAKGDEEYREKALEVIEREAKRMSGLVNRLLTLSRSDSGRLKLDKEDIDFTEMCQIVAEQQAVAAEQKNIRVETDIEDEIHINGDEAMTIRVLLNLMENAIKYGKKGGFVKLSLKKEGSYAVCGITDDGIGISEENLDKIWERFYRVDSSRTEDGSGLGLSMVDALVKAHEGKVEVRSTLGVGSCFKVYLPMRDTEGKEI